MRFKHILSLIILFTSVHGFTQISILDQIETKNHEITAIAYGPSGNVYATAGYDQNIIIRNTRGEIIKRIKGHKDFIKTMAFSSDGKYIIGGGEKKAVFVWSVDSGALTFSLKGHKKAINEVAISNKGIIASASDDKTIKLWNLNNGTLLKSLESHEDVVQSVNFNFDGSRLVSAGDDKSIKIWDGETGALLKTLLDTDKKAGAINCVRFSLDGFYISAANSRRKIVIWKAATGIKLNEIESNSGDILTMEYSPDNRFLVSGTNTGKVVVWNMETTTSIYENSDLKSAINTLAISPNGEKVLTSDFTSILYVWDIKPLGIPQMLASIEAANKGTEQLEELAKVDVFVPQSAVDNNIPNTCKNKTKNRYALIIGNEDYSSHQMGLDSEVNVDFALNDAMTFSNYARSMFCVPEENIFVLKNAKAVEMHRAIEKLNLLTEISGPETEIIFYFAGHGFPDEKTKEPYIMPVDVSGNDLRFAISIKDLYEKLTEHPHKRVTVFLDACFSGGARNQGLVAARGVRIVPKNTGFEGNLVVFSASNGQESSLPYKDEYHGMFTYMLLKKLQDSQGNITYGELGDYLKLEVAKKSIIINNKPQNPQVNISPKVKYEWRNWSIE